MQIPLTDDEVQNLIDELLAIESKVGQHDVFDYAWN
jgi:hypothetical protein